MLTVCVCVCVCVPGVAYVEDGDPVSPATVAVNDASFT